MGNSVALSGTGLNTFSGQPRHLSQSFVDESVLVTAESASPSFTFLKHFLREKKLASQGTELKYIPQFINK